MSNSNNNPMAEITEFALKGLFYGGFILIELLREKKNPGTLERDLGVIQNSCDRAMSKMENMKK